MIVNYICILEQQAGILTKPLDKSNYEYLQQTLGVQPLSLNIY